MAPECRLFRSTNAPMLAENRVADNPGSTELHFWYSQNRNYGFEKIIVEPGFISNIHHLRFRYLGLPMRRCRRRIESR